MIDQLDKLSVLLVAVDFAFAKYFEVRRSALPSAIFVFGAFLSLGSLVLRHVYPN